MYPALVLIIVNKECSIVDTFGFSMAHRNNLNCEGHANSIEHRPATIGHLIFANASTKSEQSLSPGHSSFPGDPGNIAPT
jgi:hypothetical protein